MKNKVLGTIKKYNMLKAGDGVVAGLSGGADSAALLYVLWEIKALYGMRLYAVHLNHGIRGGEAKRDELFARRFCDMLGIRIFVFERDVPSEAKRLGMTEEEAGRKIRYELFNEVLAETGSSKIAVAHNLNDNAETVLMHLCRGTGARGLGGIPPVRDNIIRPLIETERSDIERYCAEKGISYCTDSTNLSPEYTRNRVRLSLIPWLKDNLNPSVCEGISKFSQLMRSEDDYLDMLSHDALEQCRTDSNALSCKAFLSLHDVVRRRVARLFIGEYAKSLKDISYEHISALCTLAEGRSGASAALPCGITAKKDFDSLVLEKGTAQTTGFNYPLELNKPVFVREKDLFVAIYDKKTEIKGKILYTICFKYDIINRKPCFRTRLDGDKIYYNSIGGNKQLKKIFGELKISRSARDNYPLLAVEGELLWAGENRISDKYRCDDGGVYFYCWRSFFDEGKG